MNAAQSSGLARDGGRNSPKLQPVEVGGLGTTSFHFATSLQSPHEMSFPNRRQSRSAYDAPISSSVNIDYPPSNDVNIHDRTVPLCPPRQFDTTLSINGENWAERLAGNVIWVIHHGPA